MTRSGIRMCDLFDEAVFEEKLRRLASGFQKRFGDLLKYDVEAEIERYKVSLPRKVPMSAAALEELTTNSPIGTAPQTRSLRCRPSPPSRICQGEERKDSCRGCQCPHA